MSFELTCLIDEMVAVIGERADDLTTLDQAVGDGDHGINMKRGFDAIAANRNELESMSPGPALEKLGMTLVMKVGGASGPLYGSFFMSLGKALPDNPRLPDLANALEQGIASVKKRGKSDVGEKTMLDVLVPASEALQRSIAQSHSPSEVLATVIETAEIGLEATKPMQATKGRASYLGERSVGHLDPGAMSSCLLIKAACRCFEVSS